MPGRQQRVRPLRRHQGFSFDGAVQVVIVKDRQIETPTRQALHQFLLLTVLQTDLNTRKALMKALDQARQVERGDGFEAANIDLPADHVIVGQGVLFELAGHAQQFLGLAIEPCATRCKGYALGMVTDEQLHAEAVFQAFDCG
ncbi:hypothetical protein D3C76_1379190 [compost metagenome]